MRSSLVLVLAIGCGGGESPPDPDGSLPGDPFETPRFLPQICTQGEPDAPGAPNPNCQLNLVPIDAIDIVGVRITFVVRLLGSGMMFDHIAILGGATGVHLEHPQFLIEGVSGGDPYVDVVLDIAPDATTTLDASTAIIEDTTGRLSIRFDAVAPLQR